MPFTILQNPKTGSLPGLLLLTATILSSQEINTSFDWILQDGFKAMYTYMHEKNNTQAMQQFKGQGLNSLVIHLMGAAESSEEGFPLACDAWKSMEDATGLRMFMSITFGSDERFSNTEFGEFVEEGGGTINAPCPLSEDYWRNVYGDRAMICAQKGFDGALVDMEMYAADRTRFYGPCFCDHCWTEFCQKRDLDQSILPAAERAELLSSEGLQEEYEIFQEEWLVGILGGIRDDIHAEYPGFMLGYLLYYEEPAGITKGLGTKQNPALILDEYSYHGSVAGRDDRQYNYLRSIYNEGNVGMLVPGFSAERLTPSQLTAEIPIFNEIEYEGTYMNGFWFWCSDGFLNDDWQWRQVTGYSADQYMQALGDICDEYAPPGRATEIGSNPVRGQNILAAKSVNSSSTQRHTGVIYDVVGRSISPGNPCCSRNASTGVHIEFRGNGKPGLRGIIAANRAMIHSGYGTNEKGDAR